MQLYLAASRDEMIVTMAPATLGDASVCAFDAQHVGDIQTADVPAGGPDGCRREDADRHECQGYQSWRWSSVFHQVRGIRSNCYREQYYY